MSFRGRLTLFFVLIVIVPMVAVTLVIFSLISNNERGKASAQIAARQQTAINLQRDLQAQAGRAALRVGSDPVLAGALRAGSADVARSRARELLRAQRLRRVLIVDPARHAIVDVGSRSATFPASRRLLADGREVGTLEVSVATAGAYVRRVRRLTGLAVVLRRRGHVLASTIEGLGDGVALPDRTGDVRVGAARYRAATFAFTGFRGALVQVTLLRDEARTSGAVTRTRLLVGGILLGFFVLALAFALAVSRALQQQIGSFLEAARRLGGGDFSAAVPTHGNDEFAALGTEFNTMAAQLQRRLEQLREERTRVERSMRRLGEAVGSNLDRDALLGVVLATAVDGVAAAGGRASALGEDGLEVRARAGELDGLHEALSEAERLAADQGRSCAVERDGVAAMAHPLHAANGSERVLGVVGVARRGAGFSDGDRELFDYLAAQAAVSVENVDLHEAVQRQAVTDELTGLYNHRRFQEALAGEVERARRFPQTTVGLVLLDIDNFKRVNDTYGHQQGDLVLREVARVLRESSREIDAPSRYGGEELAVVLPGTDLEGAYEMAERVRAGIESLALPVLGGDDGEVLRVTASFGAAALPQAGADGRSLIAAADAALYEAKRAGKNRTVRAGVG